MTASSRVLPAVLLIFALLFALPGCGPEMAVRIELVGGDSPLDRGIAVGTAENGEVVFVRRFDSKVHEKLVHGSITADRPQWLLTTTKASGADQCKLFVLEGDGSIAAEYALPVGSPIGIEAGGAESGRTHVEIQFLVDDPPILERVGNRRLLLVGAAGEQGPSAALLLEAVGRHRIEPRLVSWQSGHVKRMLIGDGFLVVHAYSNRLGDRHGGHPTAIIVFELDALLEADGLRESIEPEADAPDWQPAAAYLHFIGLPPDRGTKLDAGVLAIDDGVLVFDVARELQVRVVLRTGSVSFHASPGYESTYTGTTSVEDHLADLARRVRRWSSRR